MSNVTNLLIGMTVTFSIAGLGVLITQGQNTWVPHNHWLAPLLFSLAGVSAIATILTIPAIRAKFNGPQKFETYRIETKGMLHHRVELKYRPKKLRIGGKVVRANDLPAHVHIQEAELVIIKFDKSGVVFDERGRTGVIVDIEILDAS